MLPPPPLPRWTNSSHHINSWVCRSWVRISRPTHTFYLSINWFMSGGRWRHALRQKALAREYAKFDSKSSMNVADGSWRACAGSAELNSRYKKESQARTRESVWWLTLLQRTMQYWVVCVKDCTHSVRVFGNNVLGDVLWIVTTSNWYV